jgi:CSLREA domain-containing protein
MKTKTLILSLLALLFAFSTQSFAATYVVTDGGDAGDLICDATCTLREAVVAANASITDDTITFAPAITYITLVDQVSIASNGTLTITGSGANVLTIDGGPGTNRIFDIPVATVSIAGVTLKGGNGSGGQGNAIATTGGGLVLDEVVVKENAGDNYSGAVFFGSAGNHVISNSTFSNNQDEECAGFQINGGALAVINSTFSGNQAISGWGGGFCVYGGSVTVRNSTITGNTASSFAGGIYYGGTSLNLGNTIVAGNTADSGFPDILNNNSSETLWSSGFNLVGDSFGDATNTNMPIDYQPTDKLDFDPLLGLLTVANGGTTPTHALLEGSPAIDSGSAFGYSTDQRGQLRPVDDVLTADAVGSDGSDIGAFEKSFAPTAAMATASGRITTPKGVGISNIRVTVTDSSGVTRAAVSNTFGYYQFTDVQAGEDAIFSVFSKRYGFDQSTHVRSIVGDTDDINFIAYER